MDHYGMVLRAFSKLAGGDSVIEAGILTLLEVFL